MKSLANCELHHSSRLSFKPQKNKLQFCFLSLHLPGVNKSKDIRPSFIVQTRSSCCDFLFFFFFSPGPKYDSDQPSYPGFERDVFKTVSDYFYSLPRPLLTHELYELFINVLGRFSSPCPCFRTIRLMDSCTHLVPLIRLAL